MKFKIFTSNPSQTKKAGQLLAEEVLKSKPTKKVYPVGPRKGSYGAFVIGLVGDLGGGKTCFLQGFAKGLGLKEKILSPTFVIIKKYKIQNTKYKIQYFFHIDCYRIQKPQEILDLGFERIIANPKNIVAIEWADRIRKIMPLNTIWINFEFVSPRKRKIMVESRNGK